MAPKLVLALLAAAGAMLAAARAAPAANPWLGQRVLNMAHQGGEDENPSNTMYAYRRSVELGTDMLEIDVHATKDGRIVAMHDASVARTTNGSGSVYDMTLARCSPSMPRTTSCPGATPVAACPTPRIPFAACAPAGGRRRRAFGAGTSVCPRSRRSRPHSRTAAERGDQGPQRLRHRLVHAQRGAAGFLLGLSPGPGVVALQVPPVLYGVTIVTPDYVRRAHAAGYAVHVWFSGGEESRRVLNRMLDMGVDGLMPAEPTVLEQVLCERRTPRPAGNPNHCLEGKPGRSGCDVRARRLGRVGRSGRVRARLARGAATAAACRGTVALTRGGRRLARRRFALDPGERTRVVTLARRTLRLRR